MAKKKSSGSKPFKVSVAAVIALVMISGIKHHHGHGILAGLDSIGSSGLSTRGGWARAFLAADGMPESRCDRRAVVAWEVAEGGGFGNQATNNPLNLNPPANVGWPGQEAIGAWAFPDTTQGQVDGLRYSVTNVQKYYPGIQSALRAGDNDQAVLTAVEDSPWAGSHYGYALTAPPC